MKKSSISIVMAILMLVFNCNFIFAANLNLSNTKKITIVHTNDTHSRVVDTDENFGFSKISTVVKQLKAENPNVLVLDAGDTLHGMPIVNVSKGQNAIKILDAVGYDFMTLGNHDFNYGYKRLLELKDNSKVKMLDANVLDADGNYLFTPYEIINMDDTKVAIFGLSTPETAYKTSPANVEGITFADPIEVSKKMVAELKDKSDIIIALTHIGLDESSVITSNQLAENVDGIDIIIDGHSHTILEQGKTVNDTLIAQTGEYDKNLGIVNIEIANNKIVKKEASLMSAKDSTDIEKDEAVENVINDIQKENEVVFSEVVTKTDIYLDGERENVRRQETNLGNLSADAVRDATSADIAFVNGGGIRTSIEAGDITKGKIAELFPFGNTIKVKKINGEGLIKVLENSVKGYPATQGAFLQVSGLKFSFDESKPEGNRVTDVQILNSEQNYVPIDKASDYTVAINDFMAIGGDDYDMFINCPIVGEFGTYEEIFANYLDKNGTKGCEVSGRINVVSQTQIQPAITSKPEIEQQNTQPAAQLEVAENTISSEIVAYKVKSGDNLTKIAAQYGTTWRKIADTNKLSNPNLIFPDQILNIDLSSKAA